MQSLNEKDPCMLQSIKKVHASIASPSSIFFFMLRQQQQQNFISTIGAGVVVAKFESKRKQWMDTRNNYIS